MRIVYIHQYFCTPTMPGGIRSFEMARRLVERGHDVQLVTSDTSPSDCHQKGWRETNEAGIAVHWLPVHYSNNMNYRRRIKAFGKFAWNAASKAAELGGDVVFATSTPLTIALPGIYAAKRNKIPMVFEVRDLWPELPIAMKAIRNPITIQGARTLERLAYRHSSHIVALSPDMRQGIINRGIHPEKVTVIPNACDFDLFDVSKKEGQVFRDRFKWLQDRPMVLYAGTLGRINGVAYLTHVAAAAKRVDPDIRFVVVGDGAQLESTKQEAQELGILNDNFFMLPTVSKREMPAILSAADICTSVFIDIEEMWSNSANKVFDTLAAGKPIAINHQGWLAELIRTRDIGLVLDPQDANDSARRLAGLLRDKRKLHQAGMAAHRTGRELFDRDQLAAKLEKLLLSAAGKEPQPYVASRKAA